jgi:hypothetical protein
MLTQILYYKTQDVGKQSIIAFLYFMEFCTFELHLFSPQVIIIFNNQSTDNMSNIKLAKQNMLNGRKMDSSSSIGLSAMSRPLFKR